MKQKERLDWNENNIMESLKTPEFNALTLKIARSRFSMEYISELEAFYKEKKGHPDYEKTKFACEMWITMTYSSHGMYAEAFEIELRHLKDIPFDSPSYYALINNAINSSEALDRNDEIVSYALGFLASESDPIAKIFVVEWYLRHYPQENNNSLGLIRQAIAGIANRLDVTYDASAPLKEQMGHLAKEYKRGRKASHDFKLAYKEASDAEKPSMLKEYLTNEPIALFRDEVKLTFGIK